MSDAPANPGGRRAVLADPADAPAPLRELAALWETRRAGRAMPARGDLPTEDLRPWLSRINMVEPVGDDFRYIVFGTAIAELIRRDWTGHLLSEMVPADTGAAIAAMFRRAVETRSPCGSGRRRATSRAASSRGGASCCRSAPATRSSG
jgi:hypothetical protein